VLPNLRAENRAVAGTTSIQHLEMLREGLEEQAPDVLGLVVMTTGGNDVIHMYGRMPPREGAMYGATLAQARPWIENFEKRLHQMIDLLEARFPGGCHVFLADIYDPTDGLGDARLAGLPTWDDGLAIHRAYNEVIHRCALQRASVHLVPIHAEFLGHGIHCTQFWRDHYRSDDPHYWYADNLEDPNDRGYDAIRRLFLIEIAGIADEFQEASLARRETAPQEPAIR
jgi:lysophospholipase L1-like esterase